MILFDSIVRMLQSAYSTRLGTVGCVFSGVYVEVSLAVAGGIAVSRSQAPSLNSICGNLSHL